MTQKNVRVLIADDSEDDRMLLSLHLKSLSGFELAGTTLNGVETIAWLNGTPPYSNREKFPYPQLLLLDYQMPGYSGLEVVQWVHDQQRHPAIILWSDALDLIDERKAREWGAAVICEKPSNRVEFIAILSRLFPVTICRRSPSEARWPIQRSR